MTTQPNAAAPSGAAARVIDLDGARAARAEAAQEPVTLRISGEEFTLPAEMPVDFALYATEGNLRASVTALLGEHAEAFFALRPSMQDFEALVEQASAVYGVDAGKSGASPGS